MKFAPSLSLFAGLMVACMLGGASAHLAQGAPKVNARWKFNETGSKTTAADSSGFGRTLTARTSYGPADLSVPTSNTTVNFVTGKFGNAADFNGSKALGGGNFASGGNAIPNGTASLTLSGWVMPRANGAFVSNLAPPGYSANTLGIETTGTPEMRGVFYNNGINTVPSGSAPATLNQWHFVTLRYDRTSGVGVTQLFLDGVGSNIVNGNRTSAPDAGQIGDYFVFGQTGGNFLGGGNINTGFNGLLDDFTLWADPLTNTQVRALYNFGRHPELGYDSEQVGSLFSLFEANTGSLAVNGELWEPFAGPFPINPDTNLPAALGDVFEFGNQGFYAMLGPGVGLFVAPQLAPEPGSVALFGVALAATGAWFYKRRRSA